MPKSNTVNRMPREREGQEKETEEQRERADTQGADKRKVEGIPEKQRTGDYSSFAATQKLQTAFLLMPFAFQQNSKV